MVEDADEPKYLAAMMSTSSSGPTSSPSAVTLVKAYMAGIGGTTGPEGGAVATGAGVGSLTVPEVTGRGIEIGVAGLAAGG